jgi:hypothetical protein
MTGGCVSVCADGVGLCAWTCIWVLRLYLVGWNNAIFGKARKVAWWYMSVYECLFYKRVWMSVYLCVCVFYKCMFMSVCACLQVCECVCVCVCVCTPESPHLTGKCRSQTTLSCW